MTKEQKIKVSRKIRAELMKQKGKRMVVGELNNHKVYGIIDNVGKDYANARISYRGKVVKTKFFFGSPFFGIPFFGFPFNFFFGFPFFF